MKTFEIKQSPIYFSLHTSSPDCRSRKSNVTQRLYNNNNRKEDTLSAPSFVPVSYFVEFPEKSPIKSADCRVCRDAVSLCSQCYQCESVLTSYQVTHSTCTQSLDTRCCHLSYQSFGIPSGGQPCEVGSVNSGRYRRAHTPPDHIIMEEPHSGCSGVVEARHQPLFKTSSSSESNLHSILANNNHMLSPSQSHLATERDITRSPNINPQSMEKFSRPGHANNLLLKMSEYIKEGSRLSDVVIIVGDKRFPANRIVLSAASDYFAAMFNSELKESRCTDIHIHDVTPEAMQTLMDYIYTGNLQLQEETIENLLSAACLLQMKDVKHTGELFLMRLLHPSNCLGIRHFADIHGCQQLFEKATEYVLNHFGLVIEQQEFVRHLSLDELIVVMTADNINVASEEVILKACLLWIKHDPEQRKQFLYQLMSQIKLPLLSPHTLSDLFEHEPMISESLDCLRLLMNAMRFHLLPDRMFTMLEAQSITPRRSTIGCLWAIGGMTTARTTQEIEEYDPRCGSWQTVGRLPLQRLQFGCALVDHYLLIVGGRDGLKTLNTVESFSLISKRWTVLPAMCTHRHGLGCSVLNGVLYAVGGHDGWSYLNSVERWDPKLKSWSFVSPMSMPRSTAGIAALHGRLYAVGGRDGGACLRSVECFDPNFQKWTLCNPMHYRRGGVAVAALDQYLYAVGGHDAPANHPKSARYPSVERYDPQTDEWTQVACLSTPRESIALCNMGHKLYALGGYDGQHYTDEVQCYDAQTDSWTQVSPLGSGRAGIVAVNIPRSLWLSQSQPTKANPPT